MMDNASRLDNLKTQIRRAFNGALKASAKTAEANSEGWTIWRTPEDLERDHALALNTLKYGQDKITDKQIDHIIARWAEAQMLVVFPEILDDPHDDIQDDVFKAIVKAEQKLSHLTRQLKDPVSGLMAADTILDDLTHGLRAAP